MVSSNTSRTLPALYVSARLCIHLPTNWGIGAVSCGAKVPANGLGADLKNQISFVQTTFVFVSFRFSVLQKRPINEILFASFRYDIILTD
jgi:hypothetical protein